MEDEQHVAGFCWIPRFAPQPQRSPPMDAGSHPRAAPHHPTGHTKAALSHPRFNMGKLPSLIQHCPPASNASGSTRLLKPKLQAISAPPAHPQGVIPSEGIPSKSGTTPPAFPRLPPKGLLQTPPMPSAFLKSRFSTPPQPPPTPPSSFSFSDC